MKAARITLRILLILFGTGMFLCGHAPDGAAKSPDYILRKEVGNGVEIGVIGAVSKYSCWSANWKSYEREAYDRGCWQVHRYMKPRVFQPDLIADWLVLHITVPDSVVLTLDCLTSLSVEFGDGRKVWSTEIVLTDSPVECQVFTTARQIIRLEGMRSKAYGRSSKGPYAAFAAYPLGSLGLVHDKIDFADFLTPPVNLILERMVRR